MISAASRSRAAVAGIFSLKEGGCAADTVERAAEFIYHGGVVLSLWGPPSIKMWDKLKTRSLLHIISGLGNIGMICLVLIGLLQVKMLDDEVDHSLDQSREMTRALVAVETAGIEFKRQVQEWKDILLRGHDPEKFAHYLALFKQRETKVDAMLGQAAAVYVDLGQSDKVQRLQTVMQLHADLGRAYHDALKLHDPADPLSFRLVDRKVAGIDRPMTEQLYALVAEVEQVATSHSETLQADVQKMTNDIRFYFSVAFAAFSVLVYWAGHRVANVVYRRIGGEPAVATDVVHAVAKGDLTVSVPDAPADSLMGAMGQMRRDLQSMVGAFTGGVEKTIDSAAELNATATVINENTATQTDAATGIAATVEEIAASISALSGHADDALALSHRAGEEARHGGELIREVVADVSTLSNHAGEVSNVVSKLEQHQQNVTNIVQVIAEIADQTNLLALNAAIEAARAGEQGRGFAVVADEVRNLAERTSQSTREIRSVIDSMHSGTDEVAKKIAHMLESVNASVERAGVAEQAVDRIVSMTGESDTAVGEITGAIHENNQAIDDIANKLERVAEMGRSNMERVQQLDQNARRLDAVADTLLQQVRRFKMQDASGVDFF